MTCTRFILIRRLIAEGPAQSYHYAESLLKETRPYSDYQNSIAPPQRLRQAVEHISTALILVVVARYLGRST